MNTKPYDYPEPQSLLLRAARGNSKAAEQLLRNSVRNTVLMAKPHELLQPAPDMTEVRNWNYLLNLVQ